MVQHCVAEFAVAGVIEGGEHRAVVYLEEFFSNLQRDHMPHTFLPPDCGFNEDYMDSVDIDTLQTPAMC